MTYALRSRPDGGEWTVGRSRFECVGSAILHRAMISDDGHERQVIMLDDETGRMLIVPEEMLPEHEWISAGAVHTDGGQPTERIGPG